MTERDDAGERRVLVDFLSGRLPDADAEQVAARLAADPQWQSLADDLPAGDIIVEAVRETGRLDPPDDTPPLRALMARLAKLAPAPALGSTCDAAAETPAPAGPALAPDGLSFLRPAKAPDELARLAGFRILEVLGRGGMGLVLRAEDVQLRRQVALKVIRPERAADPDHRERFLREARAAAQLHHDHVMPIHQIGEDNGVLFLAMPLLTGQTLEARLARQPPLTLAEQMRIGREIGEGLGAAHAAGLIHRDVKPSNVWLEEGTGRAKVLDFGLARFAEGEEAMTQPGAVLGTPAYMSPEQADGQPLDARSDLFSLGCILYRMATGQQPFARPSVTATLRAVADHAPPAPRDVAPGVPPPLSDLIVRLLAKAPADRPESAAAVAAALHVIEAGDATTPQYRPPSPRRKRGCAITITLTITALAVLVISPLWMLVSNVRSKAPELPVQVGPDGLAPPGPVSPPTPRTTYEGYVDVIVWTKADGTPRQMRLGDAGALPLHVGDQFRIEAKVTPMAYLYLFWIDTEGQVRPVYPWKPGQWGTRPAEELLRDTLTLPPTETKGYKINGDKEGMETLLLLARPAPLAADDDEVRRWFADLKPQRPVQNRLSAVWFENGQVVRNDARRKRQWFEETDIDDPVLRMQELLRRRLQEHAAFTTAVSFARQGK